MKYKNSRMTIRFLSGTSPLIICSYRKTCPFCGYIGSDWPDSGECPSCGETS